MGTHGYIWVHSLQLFITLHLRTRHLLPRPGSWRRLRRRGRDRHAGRGYLRCGFRARLWMGGIPLEMVAGSPGSGRRIPDLDPTPQPRLLTPA